MATPNTPIFPATNQHEAMSAPAPPPDVRFLNALHRFLYYFVFVSHTRVAAACERGRASLWVRPHSPLPALTTDLLHRQAAPIRYTISDMLHVSF